MGIGVAVASLLFAVVTVLLVWAVAYKRRSKQPASLADNAKPNQSVVSWQAGRWDADRRHAYVANLGEGIAYEVSVTANDRVIGTAQSVPPFRAGRLSSTSEVPRYGSCMEQIVNRRTWCGYPPVAHLCAFAVSYCTSIGR